MDAISISAASGMQSRMQSLEMLANNLANVETGGYKADREFYSIYVGADATGNSLTGDLNTLPVIESQWTDHSQGNLRNTSNPLDFAIDGDGLFAVQTPAGVRYTRNGTFRISQTGALTTGDGSPVLAQNGAQIQLQPSIPIEVTPDGNVTQNGQPVARFQLSAFDPGRLKKVGLNYFQPVAGTQPKPAAGEILQGKVEQSNVGAAESAVRLVAIMRQFEMLQKAMNLGNELNRRAIEEVARVAA
ncbi:MAG TPA: flagellar hook-basal body protein [Bryobacteraceae bacterium]|jgi:flagellar basal body rod protein FlgG|nr:flagellar hook-basal body protein [Bryobacteraceae bacterium]